MVTAILPVCVKYHIIHFYSLGFSKQLVTLLDQLNADYQTFDILEDEQVRQGLKEYSNWPTYPQLYVNGELIGGLDIIKEMFESGELQSVLPKKSSLEERFAIFQLRF